MASYDIYIFTNGRAVAVPTGTLPSEAVKYPGFTQSIIPNIPVYGGKVPRHALYYLADINAVPRNDYIPISPYFATKQDMKDYARQQGLREGDDYYVMEITAR